MIWNFIILPLSRRLVSFTSGSQLPSQRLQQGRLKAGCCLGKSTTSVTRIRNRRGAVMRFALSRFSPPLPRRIPLVKSVLSWSSVVTTPCNYFLIDWRITVAAPAKRIKIQWGQVALAVASHHGVVVQELIRISLDPPPWGRGEEDWIV